VRGGAVELNPDAALPGTRYAMSIVHPGSPTLRIRYRHGVLVDPYGFPSWALYSRAAVRLPPPVVEFGLDEMRVIDILAANERMALDGDPLWDPTRKDYVAKTPEGWTWAHAGLERRLFLVPIELHAAYRHAGGVSTMAIDRQRRGLRADVPAVPVRMRGRESVPEVVMARLEAHLGFDLPPSYRRFLAATNGAFPASAGVLSGFGLIADQQFFGLSRSDRHQDVAYADAWMRDRLTTDYLAIGYVQGGLLAVKVRGEDTDSIWYWDDDDHRAEDAHDAGYICAHLLHRCATTIDEFWSALSAPAEALLAVVDDLVTSGQVTQVRPEDAGSGLPLAMRAPWQPQQPDRTDDPIVKLFEA
jgi:hypothetical protein